MTDLWSAIGAGSAAIGTVVVSLAAIYAYMQDLGEGLGGGPEGLAHPHQLAGASPGGVHRGRSRVPQTNSPCSSVLDGHESR